MDKGNWLVRRLDFQGILVYFQIRIFKQRWQLRKGQNRGGVQLRAVWVVIIVIGSPAG